LNISFEQGARANVQVSWLAPRKMRQMVVVGSKRMVSYEDTSADESVRIYDRGLDVSMAEAPATFGEYRLTYRSGDIVVPRIEAAEPLGLELADFAEAIHTGSEPRSNSALGLEVVRALEAAHVSMERLGDPVSLTPPSETAAALAV
jgi:predicted dehydrogenase